MVAKGLCEGTGVLSVCGEDRIEPMAYQIGGRVRVTVGDFFVVRSDGAKVLVEAKSPTMFYGERNRARICALWEGCKANGWRMILAITGRPMPNVWEGPFVTDAFMEKFMTTGRVRTRLLACEPRGSV